MFAFIYRMMDVQFIINIPFAIIGFFYKIITYPKYSFLYQRLIKRGFATPPRTNNYTDIPFSQFAEYFENCTANNSRELREIFYEVYKIELEDHSVSKQSKNVKKNRYTDVVPANKGRVVLQTEKGFDGDYINASYIPGYFSDKDYIATQGPMKNILADFYRMIIQNKVRTIVMVTKYIEGSTVKCDEYFSRKVGGKLSLDGKIVVETTNIEEGAFYDVSTICVTSPFGNANFKQFYYKNWSDFITPSSSSEIVEFREAVRKWQPDHDTPIVVHCSAGVGRTGTFITIDYNITRFENGEKSFVIIDFICEMRSLRPYMVKNLDEFAFLHHALHGYFVDKIEPNLDSQ